MFYRSMLLLLLLCLPAAFTTGAESAEEEAAAENRALETQEENSAGGDIDSREDVATDTNITVAGQEDTPIPVDENFIPSERISEDLPVAFPTDI